MRRRAVLLAAAGALAAWLAQTAAALEPEVRSYRMGSQFVTDGNIDPAPWWREALAVVRDYSTYDSWALAGIDGKDSRSAGYWERLSRFEFRPPDTMIIHMLLRLPKPLGELPAAARFKIDESRINDGIIRFLLDAPLPGVNKAALLINLADSDRVPGAKRFRFRIIFAFTPLVEAVLAKEDFPGHMREVTGTLAANLERHCLSRTVQTGATP